MEVFGVLAGIVSAYFLYKIIFSGKEDFFDCVKFWFTPDIISLFRGEYWGDHWAEFKLIIWLGLSIAIGYGVANI